MFKILSLDLNDIKKLTKTLENVKTKKFILVSSIEIYGLKNNKNEDEKINTKNNSSYGMNRLYLENFIKKEFKDYLIIRLPIVYGKNFSKNAIYDLMYKNEINKLNASDLVQIYNVKNLKKDINFCIKNVRMQICVRYVGALSMSVTSCCNRCQHPCSKNDPHRRGSLRTVQHAPTKSCAVGTSDQEWRRYKTNN